ncbi:G-type lectin S-receptor-like serine/threonine-protein kinase SD3-1 [Salvia miltiorrhiza]|uniref:G-type lectin S-receptor-like serine/threonine-protein kinase SD3-1 n=1 Tax=Salvia miltiorrhiza TaxID=226208 RepID=UPI0025AC9453|nr:G-type lectin S-receptor-like serine/threonine-protein kinase SD3-1 [Salvia miltiorrhiza]
MGVSWLLRQQLTGLTAKKSGGKNLTKCCLTRCSCVPIMLLFLCSVFCGVFCDDSTMASVPIGFEVNAFDRDKVWVSENGVFAFGFLEVDGDGGDEYMVGIMYNLGDKAANLPVWTVGSGIRVPVNSTFRFAMDGRLVLINNYSRTTLWSSNTSNLGVQKANLLDSGNLVLLSSKDEVVWDSFGSPTNTLLPGQSIHFPQNLRALPTRLIASYYNLVIRQDGELALVWEYNVTYWKSPVGSKEARFDSNGVLGLYDGSGKVVWSVSPEDLGDPSTRFRHLRIDRDGNLRIYSWDGDSRGWRAVWQAVKDQCSVFGSCGSYSVCGYNSSAPMCDCLFSDSLESGVGGSPALVSGGVGCKKMTDLGNCRMNTSILVLKQTVLYGLYPSHDLEMPLSEAACREYCVNDSTCIAATSMNDGSGQCTIKQTTFISGYKTPDIHAVSFLKVCSVPLAVPTDQGSRRHGSTEPGSPPAGRGSGRWLVGAIAVVVLLTVLVILSFQVLVFGLLYRRRRIKVRTRIPFGKDAQMNPHYSVLIRLSFEEIKELTNNFANQIGTSVFRGVLPNKTPIVAKILKDVIVSEKEFRVKVTTLSGTHHRNLVSVKGFCFEAGNKCLIYEYVPNGSLEKWLFGSKEDQKQRVWHQRKRDIALGVARGLAYLHSECQKCIAHGNLKLENVLLDENMNPKLTDFGLEEFLVPPSSSPESPSERDIYMLGEMLLQIVTCRRDVGGENVDGIVEQLEQDDDLERIARISFWCMQDQPFLRPSIGEVVKVLEGTLSVDRPPSRSGPRHHHHRRGVEEEIEAEC